MIGYKAFNSDLTCREFQYEIGKTYEYYGEIEVCKSGFHFCKNIADCYKYYAPSDATRICKIEAIGDIKTDDNIKYCTDKIIILLEVKNPRLRTNSSDTNSGYCNTGIGNSGEWNSGNYNTGYNNPGNYNTGNINIGEHNTGNWNPGAWNSGCWNSGHRNTGDDNTGNRNTGKYNVSDDNTGNYNSGRHNSGCWNYGNYNSGEWNYGDYNSGLFNTKRNPKIKIFDKESDWTMNDWLKSRAKVVMDTCPYTHSAFTYEEDMTEEEKKIHPEYDKVGGYFKCIVVTDVDRQKWWNNLTEKEKEAIKAIPNFDAKKFKKCTGISINKVGKINEDKKSISRSSADEA